MMDFEKRAKSVRVQIRSYSYDREHSIEAIAVFGRECWNAAIDRTIQHFERTISNSEDLVSRVRALKVTP